MGEENRKNIVRGRADGGIVADGSTAFVLGNGPSLRGVDLHRLSPFATIGLNAAYRYWREIDWRPSHYACLDLVVGLSHRDEIAALIGEGRIGRFLLRDNLVRALGCQADDPRVINFDALRSRQAMLRPRTVTTGSHTTLWAATLGFEKIVLLGIDGRYRDIVDGAVQREGIELEIVDSGDNPNYFFDGYQQPGDKYNLPNPRPNLHLEAWGMAGHELRTAGVTVLNGNPDSSVRFFPFVNLDALLGDGDVPLPGDTPLPIYEAPAAPGEAAGAGARSRLRNLPKRQIALLGLVAICMAAVFAGLLFAATPAWTMIAISIAFASLMGIAGAFLYTRMVVIEHLAVIEQRLQDTDARLAEIERSMDAHSDERLQQ